MTECFVGLGGNFPQTFVTMCRVIHMISAIKGISSMVVSPLYRTTPVSDIEQPDYLNAVCQFSCTLSIETLWRELKDIEKELGKAKKDKDAPRLIDLDLLFFGDSVYNSGEVIVPHPKWHLRLFVLAPLADVTDTIPLGIKTKELLEHFSNPHCEKVEVCGTLT